MAVTVVTGPDGAEYSVTHPEGASEQDILSYAATNYGSIPEREGGLFDALSGGIASTTGAVLDAFDVWTDDPEDILARSAEPVQKTDDQMAFMESIQRRSEVNDEGFWQGFKNVVGAIAEEPLGAFHEGMAQLPNTAVVLGGAGAGALAGSMAGPWGTLIGGAVGLFAGNTTIETGFRAQDLVADGVMSEQDMDDAAREGLIKGGIISAVDLATFGMARGLLGLPGKAVEKAVTKSLTNSGVDASSKAAVQAVLINKPVYEKAIKAGAEAMTAAMSKLPRAGRIAGVMGLESAGETTGEYLGSVGAGLDASPTEAILEGVLSLPMSIAEAGIAKRTLQKGTNTEILQGRDTQAIAKELGLRQREADRATDDVAAVDAENQRRAKGPSLADIDTTDIAIQDTGVQAQAMGIATKLRGLFPMEAKFSAKDREGADTLVVRDQDGRQYGATAPSLAEARMLAGALTELQQQRGIDTDVRNIIETMDKSPTGMVRRTLESIGRKLFHKGSNRYTGDQINWAGKTTAEFGNLNELMTAQEAMDAGISRKNMTVAQRLNAARLKSGQPETDSFSLVEVKKALGDNFGRLPDTEVGEEYEEITYRAAKLGDAFGLQVKEGQEPVMERPVTAVEADESGGRLTRGDMVPFASMSEAMSRAAELNARKGGAYIETEVFEDSELAIEEIQKILNDKNITSDVNSAAVRALAEVFTGVKARGRTTITGMNAGERRMLFHKIRGMPRFQNPTELPVFRRGVAPKPKSVPTETRALPAPSEENTRIRKMMRAAMKGFGLGEVGTHLVDKLRNVRQDSKGNLIFGDPVDAEKSESIAEGFYSPGLNAIFMSTDGMAQGRDMTPRELEGAILDGLNHEALHALRQADLFTQKEWELLERTAQEQEKSEGVTYIQWAMKTYETTGEKALSSVQVMEEAIAELTRDMLSGKLKVTGKPRSLLRRIVEFFKRLIGVLNKSGYNTFEELIAAISSGEVGGRERGEVRTLRQTERVAGSVPARGVQMRPGPVSAGQNAEPERVESLRSKAKGLDMSKKARMERAREMGFDINQVFYHGTASDISEFDLSKAQARDGGFIGEGFYLTSSPRIADFYAESSERIGLGDAPNIIPVLTKVQNTKIYNLADKGDMSVELHNDPDFSKKLTEQLLSEGYDSAAVVDASGAFVDFVVFNQSDIRSVNAAFDLSQSDSSNILFSKRRVEPPPSAANFTPKFTQSYHISDWSQQLGVSPMVVDALAETGDMQRGPPEEAMVNLLNTTSGVIGAAEELGDISNRMSPKHAFGWSYESTQEKIGRARRALDSTYGFEREHNENLKSNAQFRDVDLAEFEVEVDAALQRYADEHAKLPVYNEAHWLAREAAVAFGEKMFRASSAYLRKLDTLVGTPEGFRNAMAAVKTDQHGRPVKYTKPTADMFSRRKATVHANGMYSAVEQALMDMNLPGFKASKKNPEGLALGTDIWAKIKSMPLKKEELKWIGLEDYLNTGLSSKDIHPLKYTREQVVAFAENGGVNVQVVLADKIEGDVYEDRIHWIQISSEENLVQFTELDRTQVRLHSNSIAALRAERDGDPPPTIEKQRVWASEQFQSEGKELYILATMNSLKDRTYRIFRGPPETVGTLGAWVGEESGSLNEARIQAKAYAESAGMWEGIADEQHAKWIDHVASGTFDFYREIKLTLPDVKGDYYHPIHYTDRNVVSFIRVTDRQMSDGTEKDFEMRKEPSGNYKVYEVGSDVPIRDLALDVTIAGNLLMAARKGAGGAHHKTTYFIEELQSDWHQKGREYGYGEGNQIKAMEYENAGKDDIWEVEHWIKEDLLPVSDHNGTLTAEDLGAPVNRMWYNRVVTEILSSKHPDLNRENENYVPVVAFDWHKHLADSITVDDYKLINWALEAYGKEYPTDLEEMQRVAQSARENERRAQAEGLGVREAPFKNDGWMRLVLKRALLEATSAGYEAIAWSDSNTLQERWSDEYEQLYTSIYNKKIPSIMKKLTKQTAVNFTLDGEPVKPSTLQRALVVDALNKMGVWVLDSGLEVREDITNDTYKYMLHDQDGSFIRPIGGIEDVMELAVISDPGYWIIPITDELTSSLAEGVPLFSRRLKGMPEAYDVNGQSIEFGYFETAREAAKSYMETTGRPYSPLTEYAKLNIDRATRIGREYALMLHAPDNPEVVEAYTALVEETAAQYRAILETGLEVQFIKGDDPYGNPRNVILDVINKNHLWVFSTLDGFGSDEAFDSTGNPMLGDSEFTTADGEPMLANDVFRVVHDYFGHIQHGVGFRAEGEENAWQSHAAMYSPLARRAMTVETRGQNSELNYGKNGEYNRTASVADTIYGDQKMGLLPLWVSEEGRLSERIRSTDRRFTAGLEGAIKADGRVHFTHYGRTFFDRTDPRKAGTGLDRFVTGKRYLEPGTFFGLTEATEDGYQRESGLGEVASEFSLEPTSLYPANADPEGLWVRGDLRQSIKNLKEAGFSGFWANNKYLGKVVFVHEPLQVDSPHTDTDVFSRRVAGNRTYTPEQLEVKEWGGFGFQPKATFKERWAKARVRWMTKFRQGVVDQFASLKDVLSNPKAWMLAQLSSSSTGALEVAIEYGQLYLHESGVLAVDLDKKSLKELLHPLGEEVDDFLQWRAGHRAGRLYGEEKEHLFTLDHIDALKSLSEGTLSNGGSRQKLYDAVNADFDAWTASITDIGVETGLINEEEAAIWAEEGFYLPFYRVLDDGNARGPGAIGNAGLVRQRAYRELKGGTQKLDDLLSNVLMNSGHILGASLKNQAAREAIRSAVAMGIARHVTSANKGKDAIYVRENGKEVWYEFDGDDGALVLDSLVALNWEGLKGPVMEAARVFKRAMTIGVTASPAFKVRNLIRDSVQAIAVADMSTNIAKNLYQGWNATGKHSETHARMLAAGGLFGDSGYIHGADPDALRYMVEKGIHRDTILDTRNGLKQVWNAYQDWGARLENINRAANYEQALADDKDLLTANFEARDHLDFARTGAFTWVRAIAQTVPFLNARLQGLDKLGRAAMDPAQYKQFLAVIGTYTIASIALYLAMKDDDDYKELKEWQRDTYHAFKLPGSDVMFFIPRPFEVGAIASMGERVVEQMVDDEVHGALFAERMLHTLTETFSFNPMPQILKPAMEVAMNMNWFTQQNIEGLGMQKLSPANRKKAWTSATAIALSEGMESISWGKVVLSPVQIQHLVKGYLGWLGATVLGATDALVTRPIVGAPVRPEMRWTDYPVVRAFAHSGPPKSTKYVSLFYDRLSLIEEAYADIQDARKIGELEEAAAGYLEHKRILQYRTLYNRQRKNMSALTKRIAAIHRSRRMTAEEKRINVEILSIQQARLTRFVDKLSARDF